MSYIELIISTSFTLILKHNFVKVTLSKSQSTLIYLGTELDTLWDLHLHCLHAAQIILFSKVL